MSAGMQGMAVTLASATTARYVTDSTPTGESRYRARFYFDPNSAAMANNAAHYLFYGDSGTTAVLRVELGYTTAGGYRMQVGATNDTTTFTNSGWVNIADAAHYIELDWQAASAAGANNGSLNWWLDGAQQTGLSGIDNDTRRIDRARLGLVAGLDTTTTGAQYFDAFESRRQTQIGSGTTLPESIFANDFESGNLSYWTSSTGAPTVTTDASLAPVGTQGMAVTLASATTARYVTDSTPTYESRYRARFYFDPNSITMANNAAHYVFYGDSGTTAVLRVELGYTTAGGYRLRVGMLNNSTTWTNSPAWVNITDAPHVIELDWQSSATGSLNWWIDETQQTALSNVDNSNRRIDRVRLGAVAGVDATTNGTLYFDAFESRRSTYIGPMQSGGETTTTITYTYDPLYRLTEADYSDGRYFRYTYDSVGNRLTEEKCIVTPCTTPITNTYVYDIANRLTSVNGQPYTWDDNGNLLNDGTSTYGYDAANRLTSVVGGRNTSTYTYNGLGDRLSQTVDSATTNYVLDMNTGLTQVLAQTTQPSNDPTTYLYGNGRIGELQPGGFAYHLGDALGSVMQLTNSTGTVTLARSFEPYGSTLSSAGSGSSVFAFAGEQVDITGLSFNRARYYASSQGRFLTADSWPGDSNSPMTQHGYLYAYANPIRYTDPSGRDPWWRDCQTIRTLHNSMSSESYNFADWSRCARQRLDEIIEKNWPDGAETIFKIFEDDELQDVWGDEAGRTSADRLGWLLSETRGTEESRVVCQMLCKRAGRLTWQA